MKKKYSKDIDILKKKSRNLKMKSPISPVKKNRGETLNNELE
jgi:hypothetical protein